MGVTACGESVGLWPIGQADYRMGAGDRGGYGRPCTGVECIGYFRDSVTSFGEGHGFSGTLEGAEGAGLSPLRPTSSRHPRLALQRLTELVPFRQPVLQLRPLPG